MRVLIKGAGDIATGIACRLHRCGFEIIMTEISKPTTIRKTVAFSQAVYDGHMIVEDIKAVLATSIAEVEQTLKAGDIAVVVDPMVEGLEQYQAEVVVDAVLAKRNIGTKKDDAPLVVAIGPGFVAGEDCDVIIESSRGHFLGRLIYDGPALPNTAIPGDIKGYGIERLIRATAEGIFHPACKIGDIVEFGQVVAYCGTTPVLAGLSGMVRGMLEEGLTVRAGMKCGDIDPRHNPEFIHTVSDKARAIGGSVLEAIISHLFRKKV